MKAKYLLLLVSSLTREVIAVECYQKKFLTTHISMATKKKPAKKATKKVAKKAVKKVAKKTVKKTAKKATKKTAKKAAKKKK